MRKTKQARIDELEFIVKQLKDENEKLSRTNRQLAKYSIFDGYKMSETEKQNSFKLIKRQMRTAKTYDESPALCYLFECRSFLRLVLKLKDLW